jgi:oxygen-dependent protoporphyrinogen oxidase
MPQYEVGHLDRMARIAEVLAEHPGIVLAGAAYGGVGIADCVRQADETASEVRAYLHRSARSGPNQPHEEVVR